MTDNAERKVREWASGRNGEPLSSRDVVDLVFALADDHDADHAETLSLFKKHCEEAAARDARIISLEEWRAESQATCVERVKRLIEEEHAHRHGMHMESEHADDFNGRLLLFFATTFGKLVIFVMGGVTLALVNWLLFKQ